MDLALHCFNKLNTSSRGKQPWLCLLYSANSFPCDSEVAKLFRVCTQGPWGSVQIPISACRLHAAIAKLYKFIDAKSEDFDNHFNINVKAMMHVGQLVTRQMIKEKNGGAVVNVSSQASQAALDNHTIYCASKAAVDHLTRVMALELGPHNVSLIKLYII